MSKEIDFAEMKNVEYVIDPDAEKRLLKKLDWILLPMFTVICELFGLLGGRCFDLYLIRLHEFH